MRGGLRAFPVSTIGDTGCSATPGRASQCRHTSDQNAIIWRSILLNRSTGCERGGGKPRTLLAPHLQIANDFNIRAVSCMCTMT